MVTLGTQGTGALGQPRIRLAASRSGGALRSCSCLLLPGSLVPLVWLTEAPSRFRPSDQSNATSCCPLPIALSCCPLPIAHCPLLLPIALCCCCCPPASCLPPPPLPLVFLRNTTLGVLRPSSRGPYSLSCQGRAPPSFYRRLRGGWGGCTSSTPSISYFPGTRPALVDYFIQLPINQLIN